MASVADIVARQGPLQDVRAYADAREFDVFARAVPANDVVAYPTLPGTPPGAVVEGGGTELDVPASALELTGYAPTLAVALDVGAGAIALTGYAPALTPTLDLGAGALTLTGYEPALEVAAPADTGPTPRSRESVPPLDLRTAAVGYDRTVRTELAARSGPVVGLPRTSTTDVRYRLARAGYEGADMASFFWGTKDPDDVLDYAIDWTGALNGDTIATSVFVVAVGAGLTINSQSNTTTSSTVWLSGGTAGTVYEVTCTITTAGARTFERTAQLTVADL